MYTGGVHPTEAPVCARRAHQLSISTARGMEHVPGWPAEGPFPDTHCAGPGWEGCPLLPPIPSMGRAWTGYK